MRRSFAATGILAFLLLLTPLGAQAQSKATFFGPIVPEECSCKNQKVEGGEPGLTVTTAPDYGCVLQVVQNVINFAVSISIILLIIYLVIAAFGLLTSGGKPDALTTAKTRILNVVIGLAVILTSWLIIDFVMKSLYDPTTTRGTVSFGPWNGILAADGSGKDRCIVARVPDALTSGIVEIAFGPTAPGGAVAGGGGVNGSCTALAPSQLTSIGNGFSLQSDAAARFKAMQAAAARDGVTITPSSGYRSPERQTEIFTNENRCRLVNGKASCPGLPAAVPCSLGGAGSNHTRGTAIDVSRTTGALNWMARRGSEYGFINSLPNDPVHFSDTGK